MRNALDDLGRPQPAAPARITAFELFVWFWGVVALVIWFEPEQVLLWAIFCLLLRTR